MNVLVTGGGGFVGKAVVKRLLELGVKTMVLGRHRYPDVELLGAECTIGNVSDAVAMDKATERFEPGNQRVTRVVLTTIDTPVLPMPNKTNSRYSGPIDSTTPTRDSAAPEMTAPAIRIHRTSNRSSSRATPIPAIPPVTKNRLTAPDKLVTLKFRASANTFMYTDML